MSRVRVTNNLRLLFIGLLVVSMAQVLWWIWDQQLTSYDQLERMQTLYLADTLAADELRERGTGDARIHELYPHLEWTGDHHRVNPAVIEHLEERRRSRFNRYRWEGGFFLVVLLGGMFVIWRTVEAERRLRKRQRDFVAAVSHELKSPLASMQLTVDSMARHTGTPEQRTRWIDRMRTDVRRLRAMITNILDSSRLERGDIVLKPEPHDLQFAVSYAVQHLGERPAAAGVEIVVEVADGLVILADPTASQAVIRNLLENALNATVAADGGTIRISGRRDGRKVELTVADDGIGFPPDDAERIFERFYRTGSELTRKTPGSGLGLAIVRHYLRLDGGSIRAESDGDGTGARFVVRWKEGSNP